MKLYHLAAKLYHFIMGWFETFYVRLTVPGIVDIINSPDDDLVSEDELYW